MFNRETKLARNGQNELQGIIIISIQKDCFELPFKGMYCKGFAHI